jgi:hypothetical protein
MQMQPGVILGSTQYTGDLRAGFRMLSFRNHLPLRDQKSVGRDAQRGMVMEAAPASSFEMPEPDLLFELLIIALDTPTEFGEVHQFAEGDVFRQGRKPIFGRLFLIFGPFDQQPLFGPDFRECCLAY